MEAYKIGKNRLCSYFWKELASLFAAKGIEPSQLENLEVKVALMVGTLLNLEE